MPEHTRDGVRMDSIQGHELLVTYETRGVLRWYHSDGRKGSDPAKPNMDDDSAIKLAEDKFMSLGNASFLSFSIEDEE
jgi:hypothetical protein